MVDLPEQAPPQRRTAGPIWRAWCKATHYMGGGRERGGSEEHSGHTARMYIMVHTTLLGNVCRGGLYILGYNGSPSLLVLHIRRLIVDWLSLVYCVIEHLVRKTTSYKLGNFKFKKNSQLHMLG